MEDQPFSEDYYSPIRKYYMLVDVLDEDALDNVLNYINPLEISDVEFEYEEGYLVCITIKGDNLWN